MINTRILTVKELRESIGVPEFMQEWPDNSVVTVRYSAARLEVTPLYEMERKNDLD